MTQDKMEIVRLHMRDNYDVAPWEWDSGELELAIYDLITNNQAKNNEVLDLVSNCTSAKDIKKYRKQGRMSGAIKREGFYKIIAERFDESYSDYDFTLLYDC